jgi:hypothetical protein
LASGQQQQASGLCSPEEDLREREIWIDLGR